MSTAGAGCLDAMAALRSTALPNGICPSPVAVFNASSGMVAIANPNQVAWSDQMAWSGRAA